MPVSSTFYILASVFIDGREGNTLFCPTFNTLQNVYLISKCHPSVEKTHVPLSISVQLCCSYHKMADFLWNTFVKKGDTVLCDICHRLQAQMEIQRDVCGASHLEFYSSTLFYSRVFALLSIKTIHLFVCLFVYLLIITGYTKTLKECLRDPELLSWRRNTGSPVYLL